MTTLCLKIGFKVGTFVGVLFLGSIQIIIHSLSYTKKENLNNQLRIL